MLLLAYPPDVRLMHEIWGGSEIEFGGQLKWYDARRGL